MVTRRWSWIALVALLVTGSVTLRADSLPFVRGNISGLELCPQSVCGAAIFTGLFAGQVGFNPAALGTMAVAVTHEDLPPPHQTAAITGGVWQISLIGRTIRGVVTGGSLYNNGDNTFRVVVGMCITGGGLGTLSFSGTLSHAVFPPTIKGRISQ